MRSNTKDIKSYVFKSTDELLLDTNVWFFVYGPHKPGDKRVAVYSRALARIFEAKCQIYTDVLIISEFINRYARLKYHIKYPNPKTRPHFKQFCKSSYFRHIAEDIAADVRLVLKHCIRVESLFKLLDINILIDEYQKGNSDFNDQVLVELCKIKRLKLVTDDIDFKNRDLIIVTANRKLLADN